MSFVAGFAQDVAEGLEAIAAAILAIGGIQAAYALVRRALPSRTPLAAMREVWLNFASWLLLALEFTLAADVAHTTASPSWDALGRLAVIAALRIVLSLALERDVEQADRRRRT